MDNINTLKRDIIDLDEIRLQKQLKIFKLRKEQDTQFASPVVELEDDEETEIFIIEEKDGELIASPKGDSNE